MIPKLFTHVGGKPRRAPTASKSISFQMSVMVGAAASTSDTVHHFQAGLATIIWVTDFVWLAAGSTVLVCYLREFDM